MTVELTNQEYLELEGFENESNETPVALTEMEATNVLATKKDNSDLYKGIGIGLFAGALAGAVAWLWERKKRLDVLAQLEISTFMAADIYEGKDVTHYGKKKIELTQDMIQNPAHLIRTVKENIDKVKMSKKEKKRWKDALECLIKLTLIWDNNEKATKAKQAKLDETKVTETLVEEK
jgi:hypothetical protein